MRVFAEGVFEGVEGILSPGKFVGGFEMSDSSQGQGDGGEPRDISYPDRT